MRRLTFSVTPQLTSVYVAEVPDDFDAENRDALVDLALSDGVLLLSQNDVGVDVRVESDEQISRA
jgi:hypothetical protein